MTEPELCRALDAVLDRDVAAVRAWESTLFDRLVGAGDRPLVLFGAGGLGRKMLAGLEKIGRRPIAFADNNKALWHKTVGGVEVLPVELAAQRHGQDAAFVVTIWKGEATDRMAQRAGQLTKLGCRTVLPFAPLFWKHADAFLPHYACDLPHKVFAQAEAVKAAGRLWADEASRREYLAQIKWRAQLDFDSLPDPVTHEIYFPDDLVTLSDQEVFMDCGAFDGDTLRSFLRLRGTAFERALTFEPDPANFEQLRRNVAGLPDKIRPKVSAHPYAVGSKTGPVSFSASGTHASAAGSGEQTVECIALDEFLKDTTPTYVKMDIEGFEPHALAGLSQTIRRAAPVLAVCVYHAQGHVWSVPLFIRSLSAEYCFFLRPHLLEVWDLVCYAIPRGRLKNRALV